MRRMGRMGFWGLELELEFFWGESAGQFWM